MTVLPLAAEKLAKSYGGVPAVRDISFEVRTGECVGFLGPNGAGKTTTMRICLGLSSADSGSVSVLGMPLPQRALEARSRCGVVPQRDSLDPDFTVAQNIRQYASYFGMTDAEVSGRLASLLEFAGLEKRAESFITELSGGMMRRLTLARALVNDPDLVFLDEPTTGLDPQARHLIWDRLRGLVKEGKTLFLTTHFMEEAERLCDRIYIVDGGVVVAHGSPSALISEHIEAEVVEVTGDTGAEWLRLHAPDSARIERVGSYAYCYSTDSQSLLAQLADEKSLRYVHRKAGLEDVFLKLTGRGLRE